MRSLHATLWAIVACLSSGCGRETHTAASPPAPSPRIVYVVVSPSPLTRAARPELTWTPDLELVPTRAATAAAAVIEMPLPTPRPTIDIASIPNMDRPRDPGARSRREQLAACLSYDVEPSPGGQWARVKVTGHNRCANSVSADESWFEVTAIGWQGGAQDRQVGRFQQAILPNGTAETYIELGCSGPCRYTAAVWWAAGAGRPPN